MTDRDAASTTAPGDRVPSPLASTLERSLTPGSNLRGRAAGGTLAFGLPTLAPGTIVCLGRPLPLVLETLRRIARDGSIAIVADAGAEAGTARILAASADGVDVLWVTGPAGVRALLDSALATIVAGARSIVVEDAPVADVEAIIQATTSATRTAIELSTQTADGIVKAATPGGDAQSPVVAPREDEARLRRVATRSYRLARRKPAPRIAAGAAVLAVPGDPRRPPAWLANVLSGAGVDPARYTWRLASPGVYDSQKLLVHLEPIHDAPALIAKVTRDRRHNDRLATEAAALPVVAALGPFGDFLVPGLVASGPVGPLWTAVMTRLDGRALPGVIRSAMDPHVPERAIDGCIALSVASAREVPGVALATPFGALLERYAGAHGVTPAEGALLDGLVARVAAAPRVPIVAQHGDPGSWNMLVAPDGRVVVLDWESFEPDGPPLWDLWHLVRSITLDLDRSLVPRRRSTVLSKAFAGTGSANDLIVDATARYRRAVPIDDAIVLPLFVFGWLHRALKESTRSRPEHVRHGHYARFLRWILANLDAPGLRRLQASGPGA